MSVDREGEIERRLRLLRDDPEARARYDLDGSGVVEEDEWVILRRIVAAEVAHGVARDGAAPHFDEPPLTGLVGGRFEVVGLLGVGGQGRTWLARDTELGEEVALKELALGRVDDWKAVELFEREGNLLRALDHAAIPRYVLAFHDEPEGQQGGARLFLAQEYVAGRSLDDELEHTHWDEAKATALLRAMLDVLGYLHGLSPPVVHRDLKPSNIMRLDTGGFALIDFGAVSTVSSGLTGGSTVVGTSGYMPLEQFMGRAVPSTDIYALGATLVHLLSRRHPADLPMVRSRLQFEDACNVSDAFAEVLRRMLEPNVEDRFQSAAEVVRALEEGEQREQREQQKREQQKREQQKREQQKREQQKREQQKREQQRRDQQRRDQQRREQQKREQQQREQQKSTPAPTTAQPVPQSRGRRFIDFTRRPVPRWAFRILGWSLVAHFVLWASPRLGSYQPALRALETCGIAEAVLGEDVGPRYFGLSGPFGSVWTLPPVEGEDLRDRDVGTSWRVAVAGDDADGHLEFLSGPDRASVRAARLRVDGAVYSIAPCDGSATNGVLHCDGTSCSSGMLPHDHYSRLLWRPCAGEPFIYRGLVELEQGYDVLSVGAIEHSGRDATIAGAAEGAVWLTLRTDSSVESGGIRSLVATCGEVVGDQPILGCEGFECRTAPGAALPHNLDYTRSWDPCDGGPFVYEGTVDLEPNLDTLSVTAMSPEPLELGGVGIQEARFSGRPAQIRGVALGPVSLRLRTDSSVASAGVRDLWASCLAGRDVPDSLGFGRNLVCDGLVCTTTPEPLPHNLDETVFWAPCDGDPFAYVLEADFEACCDFVSLGGQQRTGRGHRSSGLLPGIVPIRIRTDGSVDSGGIRSLYASCPSRQGSEE
jgi:serine/threonine protein kinase